MGAGIAWLAYDMNRHAGTIQAALAEMQSRKDSESQLALLRGQAREASGYAPFLVSILPDADSLISVPREAISLARLSGLDFSFAFGESVKGTTTTAGMIAYTMSGKGPAEKWIDFLRAFEAASPIASVEGITMASTDAPRGEAGSPRNEAGAKIYEVNAHGNIFSQ